MSVETSLVASNKPNRRDFATKSLYIKVRTWVNFISYATSPTMRARVIILQKLGLLLNSLLIIPEYLYQVKSLRGMRTIKNSKKGAVALVLANGPTANHLDFAKIREKSIDGTFDLFLVNFAILDERFFELSPRFIVLSDELTKPNFKSNQVTELWRLISTLPNTSVITPMSWHNKFTELKCSQKVCLHFADIPVPGLTRSTSPLRPYGYVPLTAYKALAVAVYMQFSEILIAGMDNSMFRNIAISGTNEIIENPNHSVRSYISSHNLTPIYPNGIEDYFYSLSLVFGTLRTCFSGRNILNLGVHSEVDCFPKVNINSRWMELVNENY
jgi:hypothetical protein